MGKRRGVRKVSSARKPADSERLTDNNNEQSGSSPVDWLSSINSHNGSPKESHMPNLEVKLKKLDSNDLLDSKYFQPTEDSNYHNDNSPTNSGLKTSSFYGSKMPSFQLALRKTPYVVTEQLVQKDLIKKNGQHKTKSMKRKHASPKNSKNCVAKRAKRDNSSNKKDKNDVRHASSHYNNSCNGYINKSESESNVNEKCGDTILDIITPDSSPSDTDNVSIHTSNGTDMELSENSSLKEGDHEINPKAQDVFSDLGSLHSEDSLLSGHGSLRSSRLIKGDNGEYYFSNSNESSPDLTKNGPSMVFHTPISSRGSPESESSSLGSKEKAIFLFGKDSDGSSYSPSCNSSKSPSPEHQTSITSFFKSTSKEGNSVGSKSKKVERSKRSKKMEQMYLDLGQRNFGHVTCTTCGMVYTHAQPDDEVEHIRHHKKFVNGLRFNGWKDEHVVKEFSDGRIIMIKPDDHPSHQKKAEEIRKVVDSELGFAVDLPYRKNESKTFLFIANKRVVGCCVATQIDKGYPVLPSTPNKDSTPDRQIAAWCCSTVPVPAQCGISKIWVWNQYRRKKVATRLIECVRTHFIYGCVISKDVLAFSDPTPDGKRLATAYVGTPEFLVFH